MHSLLNQLAMVAWGVNWSVLRVGFSRMMLEPSLAVRDLVPEELEGRRYYEPSGSGEESDDENAS